MPTRSSTALGVKKGIMDIYTDGSCSPNPGKGSWCFVLLDKDNLPEHYSTGIELNTTNNRMEMKAIIEAIKYGLTKDKDFRIYSDSLYCINLCKKLYKGKKNLDLIKEVDELITSAKNLERDIEFEWIKGHSGIVGNEFADYFANALVVE